MQWVLIVLAGLTNTTSSSIIFYSQETCSVAESWLNDQNHVKAKCFPRTVDQFGAVRIDKDRNGKDEKWKTKTTQ